MICQAKTLVSAAVIGLASSASADTVLLDPEPDTGDEALDLHIHDPSRVVMIDGFEFIAVTGKEQTEDFDCGLELWSRPAGALGPWRMSSCILRDKPNWVGTRVPRNDGAFWAPDFVDLDTIIYSVASDFEEGGTSCLGLATRDENGAWHDLGRPLSCVMPREADAPEISIIDPAYFTTSDGRAFVVTGGGTLHIAEADPNAPDLGLPSTYPAAGWTPLARGPRGDDGEFGWIEAPFLHQHGTGYYLFVNWGSCCNGVDSTYEIRVGRSDNPFGPFKDRNGTDMMDGHGSLVLEGTGSMRGPGHASVQSLDQGDRLTFHYYDADRGGLPWLGEVSLSWDDGWPKAVSRPSD